MAENIVENKNTEQAAVMAAAPTVGHCQILDSNDNVVHPETDSSVVKVGEKTLDDVYDEERSRIDGALVAIEQNEFSVNGKILDIEVPVRYKSEVQSGVRYFESDIFRMNYHTFRLSASADRFSNLIIEYYDTNMHPIEQMSHDLTVHELDINTDNTDAKYMKIIRVGVYKENIQFMFFHFYDSQSLSKTVEHNSNEIVGISKRLKGGINDIYSYSLNKLK